MTIELGWCGNPEHDDPCDACDEILAAGARLDEAVDRMNYRASIGLPMVPGRALASEPTAADVAVARALLPLLGLPGLAEAVRRFADLLYVS